MVVALGKWDSGFSREQTIYDLKNGTTFSNSNSAFGTITSVLKYSAGVIYQLTSTDDTDAIIYLGSSYSTNSTWTSQQIHLTANTRYEVTGVWRVVVLIK